MNRQELVQLIRERKSYLCIGLDTDIHKIPKHLLSHPDPIFAFNKAIIDATKDICVAYKINTAFYECQGIRGWESLQRTVEYIPKEIFTIADAKRGDIGNTSTYYAKTFYETYGFDSVTVAPYMGRDSVEPFLAFSEKWAIVLGLTSNEGSRDVQQLQLDGGGFVYEQVMKTTASWGTPDNMMFVVGATKADVVADIRRLLPDHFFLVPGVGAQGGSLKEISEKGMNKEVGLLVNASRAVIYAGNDEKFAEDARAVALQYQAEMAQYITL
ncbi:orotidine-5'-phosphate decarboxylase [Chitinophaga sp. SYP-B3965]|uniref:orotidine-5'-phosphate decarboxylase n=1 Tax=Chitinophaga sp. SYP-B3965 TaxID=2663120 RepID=UPI001299A056|nr:orotidine-5'-phosphate decarboxylase [Chitinophaga sp. SYP-B3965]MRG45889.1 orotidine-5'-phosphate decarboxylase [Chitinophaga sp. SYP-B3965]